MRSPASRPWQWYAITAIAASAVLHLSLTSSFRINQAGVRLTKSAMSHRSFTSVELSLDSPSAALAFAGVMYLQSGSHDAALQYFSQAVASPPDRPTELILLGDAYFASGQDSAAFAAWSQAGITDSLYYRRRGNRELKAGAVDAALRYFHMATQLSPADTDAWQAMASIYLRLGLQQNAAKAYEQAGEKSGDPYEAALLQGKAAILLADWPASLAAYRTAQRLRPAEYEPYVGEGYVLFYGLKDLPSAIAAYESALRLDPKEPEPYVRLVEIYTALENYSDADFWFMRGDAQLEDSLGLLQQQARSLIKRKDDIGALTVINRMADLNPEYELTWALKGDVLRRMGLAAEAAEAYRQAIDLAVTGAAKAAYRVKLAASLLDNKEGCEALKELDRISPSDLGADPIVRQVEEIHRLATTLCRP